MGVISSVAVRLRLRLRRGRARRGAAVLMAACCLVLSACTAGGGAAAATGSPSASGDGTTAGSEAGSGDAVAPATGGDETMVAPALPPPRTPPAMLGAEADGALAVMPGLYGLVHLDPEVLDDHIAFRADADCGIVMDILQSGQWALEPTDGADPGGTAAGEPGPAEDEADGVVTRLATLRLGGDVAPVRLIDAGGSCSGTIARPAAG